MPTDIEVRVSTLEREMHEVNRILLVGNGRPPLTARTAELEVRMDAIENNLGKINSGINRVVWLVLSSVIGQVLYVVFGKG